MLTNLFLNVLTYHFDGIHCVEKQEILSNLIKKIFREINSLVTSLLSRNFCQNICVCL